MLVRGERKDEPAQEATWRARRIASVPGAIVLVGIVLILPIVFGGDFERRFAAEILIIGIAVMSLDIVIGYGGLVSLGHAALFGGAAYAAALAAKLFGANLLLVLFVGIATGLVLAAVIGCLVVRTASLFFLILTLVTAQMVWEIVFHWRSVTGGADGFRGIPPLSLDLGITSVDLAGSTSLYLVSAAFAIVAFAVAWSFIQAPIGRALIGSREQPLRMQALGYSISRIRLLALLAAGAIAGAAGSLYPFVNQYVGPNVVHWSMSAVMVIMLVIGGVGTLYGGFIGAAIYLAIQNYASSYTDRWQLVVGLVFVLIVILMPKGVSAAARIDVSRLVARMRMRGS